MRQPRFVFLHIPKTGGMTLRYLIFKQFQGVRSFIIKKAIDTKLYLNLPEGEKNKLGLLLGHFQFSDAFTFPDETNYFTMLRDPLKRSISHYNYLNFRTRHPFYQKMVANNYSLLDMLTQGHVLNFDNCMVRFLSGNLFKEFGTINHDDYTKAIENFDAYFQHFGINEHFNESILVLHYELGWRFPYYAKINTTDKKKINSIEDDITMAALVKCNKYDLMLYDYGLKKFKEKMEFYNIRLAQDLIKLKEGNKWRNYLLKLHYTLFSRRING